MNANDCFILTGRDYYKSQVEKEKYGGVKIVAGL